MTTINFYLLNLTKIKIKMLKKLTRAIGIYKIYERWLYSQIKNGEMPSHVAIILDGNRRWAKRKGLPPWIGHKYGALKLKNVLTWLLNLNVRTITLYVLSTENLEKRKKEELEELFKIIEENLRDALNDEIFDREKIKFKAIGEIDLLPKEIRDLVKELEKKTEKYNNRYLNIAIAYGGRNEILTAIKKLAVDVKNKKIDPEKINKKLFEKYLFTHYLPNPSPDLIIRTSGEERLSNFLLWQSAYSELCFLDVYWPDFRKIDLWRAIRIFQKRERRFGS